MQREGSQKEILISQLSGLTTAKASGKIYFKNYENFSFKKQLVEAVLGWQVTLRFLDLYVVYFKVSN